MHIGDLLRILLILIIIKILELSRSNLDDIAVKRTFYDLLNFFLILAFLIYLIFYKSKKISQFEKRVRKTLIKFGNKWLVFLDILAIIILIFYTFKVSGLLYKYPINCRTADMLPFIRGAGEYLLSLENPFDKKYCPWNLHFPYPPMMMIYYLPSVLLKFDIRFISYLFFVNLLLVIYYYHRKKGFNLTGFLIYLIIISSSLIHLFLMRVHTFPFLFILSVVLYSLSEKKDKLFFFSLAIALATRRLFWFLFPIFAIYSVKQKKISFSNVKYFVMGLFIGFFPALLYPKAFLTSQIYRFQDIGKHLQDNLFLKHSLGLSYYFYDLKKISTILMFCLLIIIYLFAIKHLRFNNLWLFLSLILVSFLYFLSTYRPEEHYFLSFIVILGLFPLGKSRNTFFKKGISVTSVLISTFVFFIMLLYPYVSGRKYIINPLRGKISISQSGYIATNGHLEFSVGGNIKFRKDKELTLLLRRIEYEEDKPVRVKLNINEKIFFNKIFNKRRIKILIDANNLNKYFIIGSNFFEITLDKPEPFSLKLDMK